MTLVERINALAGAIGNYLRDSVLPRLLPAGGTTGQVLAKTSAGDFTVAWQAGGGGGSLPPWQAVTVDLGAPAALRFVFVLVPGMTPADTIEVMRSSAPAPGKGTDEHKAEPVALAAYAAAGGFELVVQALGCTIGGSMTINYRVT